MARCTTARAVEGGADLRSRTTSPTLSPVKESTGRVAASARSARRIEAAGFLLPTECAKAGVKDEGGRKELDEERKGEEDAESERRRGEATAAAGIVAALLRWGAERGEDGGSAAAAAASLFIHTCGHYRRKELVEDLSFLYLRDPPFLRLIFESRCKQLLHPI
jgi:hypothetical protein